MQKSILSKGFEQIQTPVLPKKAQRIITSIARRHRHLSHAQELSPKQVELASALLRMKLYQAFGPNSQEFSEEATQRLHEYLGGINYQAHTPFTSREQTV